MWGNQNVLSNGMNLSLERHLNSMVSKYDFDDMIIWLDVLLHADVLDMLWFTVTMLWSSHLNREQNSKSIMPKGKISDN